VAIFITGASGFVGLNLLEQLLARGETVFSFGLVSPPPVALRAFAALPGQLRHMDGDVRHIEDLDAALAESGAHKIIHTAVITAGPAREQADPSGIVATNIEGTVNVLEAARHHAVERFLYLSSASVYGRNSSSLPELSESSPAPLPESLYAVTKFAAECIALRYRDIFAMDVVAARLSAVFGRWEHDTGLRDTLSPPYLIARMAASGQAVELADEGARDWIYAPDAAAGVIALIDAEKLKHALYNVGPGRTWSLVDWCEQLADRLPGFSYRLCEAGKAGAGALGAGAPRSPLAITRIRDDTGFVARFGLGEALDDYLPWLEQHRL
jgi:nucleoside-diphosphate-sugar epimerase